MNLPAFIRRSLRAKMTAVVLATTFIALLVNALALLYYNAVTLRECFGYAVEKQIDHFFSLGERYVSTFGQTLDQFRLYH